MRTTIVLDNSLVEEAMRLSGITTKRELVDQALREFIASRTRLDVREFKVTGALRLGYDTRYCGQALSPALHATTGCGDESPQNTTPEYRITFA